ncbi:MAG: hypothetical protein SA378_11420 [Sedimentibacter sp.]|uniref:hypothetical protein n=1 Tax=Sedimentibacter sp. TaxID=1960295 RepID=UPI0029810C24|nr:hypothetical protein [Sedimentibacter sp.]MDW5300724.1 hypothetical protein [Sedimentibacter sp.]
MFRGLRPDEIEVRVGSVSAKGASLLLYKDARCDMNILDEVYGPEGWQRKHEVINNNLYCGIGIWNKDIEQWVWKWDCGTESFTEKEKGEASDAFKRAAFNIGIGRELYTGGFIFANCPTKAKQPKGFELDNPYQFSGAKVTDIQYKETENKREIIGLVIKDSKGVQLFAKYGQVGGKPATNAPQASNPVIPEEPPIEDIEALKTKVIDRIQLAALEAEVKRTGVKTIQICKEYRVTALRELKLEQWTELMKRLQNVPNKKIADLGL